MTDYHDCDTPIGNLAELRDDFVSWGDFLRNFLSTMPPGSRVDPCYDLEHSEVSAPLAAKMAEVQDKICDVNALYVRETKLLKEFISSLSPDEIDEWKKVIAAKRPN